MYRIAVTQLEYHKAQAVFDAARSEGLECLPAPAAEHELAVFVQANRIDHVIIGVEPYREALYQALPRGAVIARFGIGMDGVDQKKATAHGLICANTPGALDDSVAEFAIGLLLAAARHLAGAALDVFEHEPYRPAHPDKDLRTLDNVIMTPHLACSTAAACRRMATSALQAIAHETFGQPELFTPRE